MNYRQVTQQSSWDPALKSYKAGVFGMNVELLLGVRAELRMLSEVGKGEVWRVICSKV